MAGHRILMVNTETGWRGGENQVFLLTTGLSAEFAPIVACQPDAPLARHLGEAGAQPVQLRMRGPLDLGAIRRLRALIRERDIALVHAHTSHAHSLALLASLGREIPVVVTRRVDFPVGGSLLGRWKYGRRVTRFVAISREIERVLVAGGVDPAAIELIPSGVDFARLDAAAAVDLRRELGAGHDDQVVGITAALTDHKDHRTLLSAWQEVERAMPRAWLAIIGSGELDAELRAHAQALGLARARFVGFREDVPGLLKRLDAFVLSSQAEGLGTAIMDAMRCGLPVVACAAGGIPELIRDGVDGLLVPPRTPTALAAALIEVLRDRERAQRLGAAARVTAEQRFSHRRMVDGYEQLYRRLLAAPRSP